MAAAVLTGAPHAHPSAHLQIKYVSRLPNTRAPSPLFATHQRTKSIGSPTLSATVSETQQSWTITTHIRNTTNQPHHEAIKIYAWPMFAPEDSQFVGSAGTTAAIMPGQSARVTVEVPKRELAVFREGRGGRVLEEGIYMFEIRGREQEMGGVRMGLVKQVGVVGGMSWKD